MPNPHRELELFRNPQTFADLVQQVDTLRAIVLRLAQEVEVARAHLRKAGQLDEHAYSKAWEEQIISDHWGGGTKPPRSYHRYLDDEDEFVRTRLGFSAEEAHRILEKAREVETYT
jgi:hypothetical protein